MKRAGWMSLLCAFATLFGWPAFGAGDPPERLEVWDLDIGMAVSDIPAREFINISCGTDGGPPSIPLKGFVDYGRCPAEETGLHEVYFQYDDELEYWARATEDTTLIARYSGTRVFGQLAIVSVLIDDAGIVRGMRIVSDPRTEAGERRGAVLLGQLLLTRFGEDRWSCEDLELANGETPVGGTSIKRRCRQIDDAGRLLSLRTNYFRKRGQEAFNPHTGAAQPSYFEASCRFEILDRDVVAGTGS